MGTNPWKMLVVTVSLLFTAAGCASQQDIAHEKQLEQQNEYRLHSLEENIKGLNEQISMLNNRVYEVRTKTGKKTGMTVAPMNLPPSTQSTAAPNPPKAAPETQAAKPQPAKKALQAQAKKTPPVKPAKKTPQAVKKGQAARRAPNLPLEQAQNTTTNFALPPSDSNDLPNLPPTDASLPPAGAGVAALPPTLPLEGEGNLALPPATQAKPEVKESAPRSSIARGGRTPNAMPGEEAQYKSALKAAQSGRSQEGIQKFRQFLQKYPNGKYAANAEFWIGECFYSQGKYQEALGQFKTVNSKYPGHHKNADALLKAGMTYKRLGDQESAKSNYQQLMQQFPKSEAARRARSGR